MAALVWLKFVSKIIQMVSLSVCEMGLPVFIHFASNLALSLPVTTEGLPDDSSSWTLCSVKHYALFLNSLILIFHQITVNFGYLSINDNARVFKFGLFSYSKRRFKSVSATYRTLGGIIIVSHFRLLQVPLLLVIVTREFRQTGTGGWWGQWHITFWGGGCIACLKFV